MMTFVEGSFNNSLTFNPSHFYYAPFSTERVSCYQLCQSLLTFFEEDSDGNYKVNHSGYKSPKNTYGWRCRCRASHCWCGLPGPA